MGSPKDVLADLRREALKKDGTLEEAEKALGVSSGYLSHVLASHFRPGRDYAAKIQDRYGISVTRWASKPRAKRARRRGSVSERHQTA